MLSLLAFFILVVQPVMVAKVQTVVGYLTQGRLHLQPESNLYVLYAVVTAGRCSWETHARLQRETFPPPSSGVSPGVRTRTAWRRWLCLPGPVPGSDGCLAGTLS